MKKTQSKREKKKSVIATSPLELFKLKEKVRIKSEKSAKSKRRAIQPPKAKIKKANTISAASTRCQLDMTKLNKKERIKQEKTVKSKRYAEKSGKTQKGKMKTEAKTLVKPCEYFSLRLYPFFQN
jgi:hypothetical protein